MRRLYMSMVVVAVVCIAMSASAIVIGDFETGLDGWSAGGSASISQSAVWSSTGGYSLRVEGTGGFVWGMYYDNLANLSQLDTLPVVVADVYWLTSDWTTSGDGAWARWDQVAANSSETGWAQTDNSMMTDSANPSYPGSWDPYNWGASHQRTIAWDMSSLVADTGIGTGGWAQFNIAVNEGSFDAPGVYYIDNIQLIPEPGTLALLGLGALALGLRRRHR